MIRWILAALAATVLIGCASAPDVSSTDVKSKEDQAEAATKALNGGKTPSQGQESQ